MSGRWRRLRRVVVGLCCGLRFAPLLPRRPRDSQGGGHDCDILSSLGSQALLLLRCSTTSEPRRHAALKLFLEVSVYVPIRWRFWRYRQRCSWWLPRKGEGSESLWVLLREHEQAQVDWVTGSLGVRVWLMAPRVYRTFPGSGWLSSSSHRHPYPPPPLNT